mgnify:CR=1 FL=1
MVARSIEGLTADGLDVDQLDVLFIENVGNLVCPAMWDLGERAKVAVLSVTEGEDKPLKYPDMFAASSLMLLNKADLLPHLLHLHEVYRALLKQRAKVSMLHIPYRGGAPAVNDLLAGHAQVMIINPDIVLPHVQAGKLVALATTGRPCTFARPKMKLLAARSSSSPSGP